MNKAALNTKNWGGLWWTSLSGQCTLFSCIDEWHAWFLADKIDLVVVHIKSPQEHARFAAWRNLKIWRDLDVTTISISRNNRLRRPVSLRHPPQLTNNKIKNRFRLMRCSPTALKNLEAQNSAVVVEFTQRSNHFKLPNSDSKSEPHLNVMLAGELHVRFKNRSSRKVLQLVTSLQIAWRRQNYLSLYT